MSAPVRDGYDLLLHSAWTTSTELVGELGLDLLAFQDRGYESVSPELRQQIGLCLSAVRQVCPGIRRPIV